MSGKANESQRVTIAAAAACAVFLFLVVFSVLAYNGKRKPEEPLIDDDGSYVSYDYTVSESDTDEPGDEVVPGEEDVSSEVSSEVSSDVSSAPEEEYVIDMQKNKNEYIRNPDYKSKYYIVIYTKNQALVAYKKDKNGGYTVKYRSVRCSTGKYNKTPTKEGVYRIEKKYRWKMLMSGVYGQYASLISEENGYYIHSVPYKEKNPSTMSDDDYDLLGKSASHGCIRLCTRDAFWVYLNMPVDTQVCVVDAKGPSTEGVPRRNKDPKYSGWDPSDKWADDNPYFSR